MILIRKGVAVFVSVTTNSMKFLSVHTPPLSMSWANNHFESFLWESCPCWSVQLWTRTQPSYKILGGIRQAFHYRSHYYRPNRAWWRIGPLSRPRRWRVVWQNLAQFQWKSFPTPFSILCCKGPSLLAMTDSEWNASGKKLYCKWDPRQGHFHWRSHSSLPAAVDPMEQMKNRTGMEHVVDLMDRILAGMRCFHLDYFFGWGSSWNHRC